MNDFDFIFCGASLKALPSGALWWPENALFCVSDLHLGKSERVARRTGQALPPYETRDTLDRLEKDLAATNARLVICLGDSFDDLVAAGCLPDRARLWINKLQTGRRWVWIEGNHDPGPVDFGGEHRNRIEIGGLTFRHVATTEPRGEVSGHYHPKARLHAKGRIITRPAFIYDTDRLLLPAYGTYTGGLNTDSDILSGLMHDTAYAILTGPVPTRIPMPRQER
jgi:DNA ligase-associated metallophosphoesterase